MMRDPKITGQIIAWGAEDWIRPAIKQALEFCDEVVVLIAPFNPALDKFADSTYKICKEYRDIKLVDFRPTQQYVIQNDCDMHNYMLKESSLFAVGNWIWILDVDEFYFDHTYKKIRSIINAGNENRIGIKAKIFYINMQHYLRNSIYWSLFKINYLGDKFKPTHSWPREEKDDYVFFNEDEMFHYTLLTNMNIRLAWWKIHHPHTTHPRRREWLTDIYLNYNLEDEDNWIEKNLEMSGLRSPSFTKNWKGDENGRLFKYNDRHPKFIEETELPRIKDFREIIK